jgi:hypothetical protein
MGFHGHEQGYLYFFFTLLYVVSRTPWTGDQPVARLLPTQRTTQTQNKPAQTFMPRVGFKATISAFERAKRVHASDRAATVIGWNWKIVVRFSVPAWHIQSVPKASHTGRTHVTILVLSQLFIDAHSIRYYSLIMISANSLYIQSTSLMWECTCSLYTV